MGNHSPQSGSGEWEAVFGDTAPETALSVYSSKGEREYAAVDGSKNDRIDFAGTDRITRNLSVVYQNGANVVRRTAVRRWQTEGVDSSVIFSWQETAQNTPKEWQSRFDLLTKSETTLLGGGMREVKVTAPDGSFTVSTFNGDRLSSVVRKDSQGVQIGGTTYEYDPHGRKSEEIDARNGSTEYGYYDTDQVAWVRTPPPSSQEQPLTTGYQYNSMGQVVKVIHPGDKVTESSYYPTGDLERNWGSQTYETRYTYDPEGRQRTLVTVAANPTTPVSEAVTEWIYNTSTGRLASKKYHDGKATDYTWTPAGRLWIRTWARPESSATNAPRLKTTYTYGPGTVDLLQVDYSDSTPDVTFVYNRRGLPKTITDAAGTRELGYNTAGHPGLETFTSGNFAGYGTEPLYDSLLRRNTFWAYSPTLILTEQYYLYDKASRLEQVQTYPVGLHGTHHNFYYDYEADSSLLKSVEHEYMDPYSGVLALSIVESARTYDALNRLKSISTRQAGTGEVISSHAYKYNALGQREEAHREDGTFWKYGYNGKGEVTSGRKHLAGGEALKGFSHEYQFDGIGNRTQTVTNGQVSTYDLKDNGLNQYQSRTVPGVVDVVGQADPNAAVVVGGTTALRQGSWFYRAKGVVNSTGAVHDQVQVNASIGNPPQTGSVSGRAFVPKTPETFTYDEDGNLTHDGRWKYTWDGENRLIEVVANPNLVLPDTAKLKLAFAYDYMGRRISKKVYHWNATTLAYSTSPAVERKYLYDGWNLVAELDGSNNPVRAYTWGLDLSGSLEGAGGVGGLLAASSSAGTHFVAYDGNGNVMKLLNSETGAPEAEYEYGPFGELVRMTGGDIAKGNPFRFSTKYQDQTGLLYYGYRYYDPGTGRWLSRDPIEENDIPNLYCSVANKMVSAVDLLGLTTTLVLVDTRFQQVGDKDMRYNNGRPQLMDGGG